MADAALYDAKLDLNTACLETPSVEILDICDVAIYPYDEVIETYLEEPEYTAAFLTKGIDDDLDDVWHGICATIIFG